MTTARSPRACQRSSELQYGAARVRKSRRNSVSRSRMPDDSSASKDAAAAGYSSGQEAGAMKWRGQRESDEVEDRRGMSVGRGGLALGGGGLLLILLFSALTGTDPTQMIQIAQGVSEVGSAPTESGPMGAPTDETGKFASVVLASTEDV